MLWPNSPALWDVFTRLKYFKSGVILVNSVSFKEVQEKIQYLKVRLENSRDWSERRWLTRQLREIIKNYN